MIVTMGLARFRETVLFGQYSFPKGLYYGGKGFEQSAEVMNNLLCKAIVDFEDIMLIDTHSGYGPRYQMTLVNSVHEERDSDDLQKAFDYPQVAKTDPDEYYQMQGDMVDYLYLLKKELFPEKRLYATSFEFGTYGDSLRMSLRSYKAMINENRLFHYGAKNDRVAQQARIDFDELFNPQEMHWREKAIQDARQALSGIIRAEGFGSDQKSSE